MSDVSNSNGSRILVQSTHTNKGCVTLTNGVRRWMVQWFHNLWFVPLIANILQSFHRCVVFSSLDLVKVPHQIPMDSKAKTAILTSFSILKCVHACWTYECITNVSMTQRYCLARAIAFNGSCQRNHCLFHEESHRLHLEETLSRLNTLRLWIWINANLSIFWELLRYKFAVDGIRPTGFRLKTINVFPKPGTVSALCSFLGRFNFCPRFLPRLSEL